MNSKNVETLIAFWSDVENVKRAKPEDIQSDIISYLEQIKTLIGFEIVYENTELLEAENA